MLMVLEAPQGTSKGVKTAWRKQEPVTVTLLYKGPNNDFVSSPKERDGQIESY